MLLQNKKVVNRKENMASQNTESSQEDIVEQNQAREAENDREQTVTSDEELVKEMQFDEIGTTDMINMMKIVLMRRRRK